MKRKRLGMEMCLFINYFLKMIYSLFLVDKLINFEFLRNSVLFGFVNFQIDSLHQYSFCKS